MMAVCQFICLRINDFSVFTFTPITTVQYISVWCGLSIHWEHILPQGLIWTCNIFAWKIHPQLWDNFRWIYKNFILMTLNNIFVEMICFLYSMIFSVTLMLFKPGCVSIDFILMYISNQLCCWLALDKDKLTVHISREAVIQVPHT